MYGLKFKSGGDSLICLNADFRVEDKNKSSERYRFAAGPHGGYLDHRQDGEWVRLAKGRGVKQQLLDVLPTNSGVENWTWPSFLLALSFWAEGYSSGEFRAGW